MSDFADLLWNIKAKGFEIVDSSEDTSGQPLQIRFIVPIEFRKGWIELIKRLNIVYDNPFSIEEIIDDSIDSNSQLIIKFKNEVANREKVEDEASILRFAISREEYLFFNKNNNTNLKNTLDIKLGISCNNNCEHCVIKPNIYNLQKLYPDNITLDGNCGIQSSRDLSYQQVIETILQQNNVGKIVLTGGEPTIRKDFISIVKWLYYNKPRTKIEIQTNGRNFSDIYLVKQLRRYLRQANIAVAIHGNELTHNRIVNNRKDIGNPFQETVTGIKNLLKFFPDDSLNIRTEMVLSTYNINNIMDSVRFQVEELGLKCIGISYPHLDGFDDEKIKELAPAMSDVYIVMKKINEYLNNFMDVKVLFEEIPPCFYNQLGDNIRIGSFSYLKDNILMNFTGRQTENFCECWKTDHEKFDVCAQCILNNDCVGFWKETRHLNENFAIPVKNISSNLRDFLGKIHWPSFKSENQKRNQQSLRGERYYGATQKPDNKVLRGRKD